MVQSLGRQPYDDWMTIVEDGQAILCGVCKMTSWSPGDVENGYCGKCQKFYQIRTAVGINVRECELCNETIFNSDKHECGDSEWKPGPYNKHPFEPRLRAARSTRLEINECKCGTTFMDDGEGLCTACRDGNAFRLKMLFADDEED